MKTKLVVISSLSRPVAACVLMAGAGLVCAALLLAGANVRAANVGPGGYTNAFSTAAPAAADWSTLPVAGSSGTIVDAAGLNATVQASAASSITTALGNGVSVPPAPPTGGAVWTSDGLLQTRPTTVACTLLMATLVNTSGTNATSIQIMYDFIASAPANEPVFGHLVYYSLTGATNSWQPLATLQSSNSTTLSTNVPLAATWYNGSTLYLLFADDNGPSSDTANQIDNFFIGFTGFDQGPATVTVTSPADTQNILQGTSITINASTTGAATNVTFYRDGGVLVGSDASYPYSVVYSNATLGAHTLTAVVEDSLGLSATSSVVNITVAAPTNSAPSFTLSGAGSGLPSGAVSWFKAENNANDSIGGGNGTLQGGTTYGAGKVGQAFVFNGNSYVTAPSSPALDFGGTNA